MQIHVSKDPTALNREVAEWMTKLIAQTLIGKEKFCLLLSGGNTPKNLYRLLAGEPFNNKIEWRKVHIFFGDERVVPFNDERNNGKMAFDTLLSKVPIPKNHIHYIDTTIDPEQSALDYASVLLHYFDGKGPTFDLALLGMGDDGHTLSLFPKNEAINKTKKSVISVPLPSQQMYRITLSADVVNRSTCVAFLVTGAAKSEIVKKVIHQTAAPHTYPVQLINPLNGELHWFVDEEAYSGRGPDS
jgi:6-phosphogluconolactonase